VPAGPVGVVDGAEDGEVSSAEARPWGVSLSYAEFAGSLRFDGSLDMKVRQRLLSARLRYAFAQRWYVAAALGATLGGSLQGEERRLEFNPGVVATLQSGVLLLEAHEARPFIEATLNLSVSHARLKEGEGVSAPWTAFDARLGLTIGWHVASFWVPYAAFRVFGGPALWTDGALLRTGSDRHHVQVALGSTFRVMGLNLFAEWAPPVGESGVAAGVAYAF